jgi:hypothetical protein
MIADQMLLIHHALTQGQRAHPRLPIHRPWRERLAQRLRDLAVRLEPRAASPYRPDASRRTAS